MRYIQTEISNRDAKRSAVYEMLVNTQVAGAGFLLL
jgi:hypothetical protein